MTTELTQPIPETVNQETQEQQQIQETQANGIQARINELTAARREAERQAQSMVEQNARLSEAMAKLAAQQLAPQAPAAPVLPEGMDPSFAVAMEQMAKQAVTPLARQLEAQIALLQRHQERMLVNEASATLPQDVQENAAQLLDTWRQKGFNGWNPNDAAVYALGQKVNAQLATGNPELRKALFGTNAAIAAAVRGSVPPTQMQVAAPPVSAKSAAVPELPDDLDLSDPDNAALAYQTLFKKLSGV